MSQNQNHIIYDSEQVTILAYLKNVAKNFSVITFFAKTEIKTKYVQTVLGPLLSYLQAIISITVFTIFFDYLLKVDTGTVPYVLFCSIGLMSWYNFSYLTGYGGLALVNAQHLIRKLTFPKLALPLSKALVSLFEMGIWLSIVLVLMIVYQFPITYKLLFLPIFIVLNLIIGLSITIWISALSIRYRDFFQIIPYIIGFGMFVTPVFYPGTMIPEKLSFLLFINPMAGILECLRWSLASGPFPDYRYLIGIIPIIILFVTGILYFKSIEHKITDLI